MGWCRSVQLDEWRRKKHESWVSKKRKTLAQLHITGKNFKAPLYGWNILILLKCFPL